MAIDWPLYLPVSQRSVIPLVNFGQSLLRTYHELMAKGGRQKKFFWRSVITVTRDLHAQEGSRRDTLYVVC